jgi:hypothetical protein
LADVKAQGRFDERNVTEARTQVRWEIKAWIVVGKMSSLWERREGGRKQREGCREPEVGGGAVLSLNIKVTGGRPIEISSIVNILVQRRDRPLSLAHSMLESSFTYREM